MLDFNIVTFHTAYNHGAVLQTLALQEFISNLGYQTGIYDYRPPFMKVSGGAKGEIFKILRKMHEKDYELKEKRFQEFVVSNLNLNKSMESSIFLSGSDQVWNPSGSMNPVYFLQFVGDKSLRASYAASMGVSEVPETKKELFGSYIKYFDAISVREEEVKKCVSEYYGGDIEVNVDPTLLMNREFWRKYMQEVPGLPDKYILAYILHLPKNINGLLKWLQKDTGAKIVLIDGQGAMTHLVKNDIALHNLGPAQFLWLVDHAQSIVTSSFHGTAFSVIFEKEFYSIINPNSPSRISNLLKLTKLEEYQVKETDKEYKRNLDISWSNVSKVLDEERKKSEEYIHKLYQKTKTEKREKKIGNIELVRKKCTGCSACEAICPVQVIRMKLNTEGFYEPVIDKDKCINCSKCIRTCPVDKKIGVPKKSSFYGWNKDAKVCSESSSGGVFRALADEIIKENGIVYGAVYTDDWKEVVFGDSDHVSLKCIQKSKYTVSNPSKIYPQIKSELEKGRKVMFCGTPCQNAGLTQYLEKTYSNLLKCDFVCGGMASLRFYREHLKRLEKKYNSKIVSVDFRPKDKGWGKQRIKIQFQNKQIYIKRSHLDSYFKCFANNHVSVRETCLACEYHAFHVSDITLADFWGYKTAGIRKNREGLSLVVGNTEEGVLQIENNENLNLFKLDDKYSDYAFRSKSPNLVKIRQRSEFFDLANKIGFEEAAEKLYGTSEIAHIKSFLKLKLKI